jgi:iron complex outermembrane receptor protein
VLQAQTKDTTAVRVAGALDSVVVTAFQGSSNWLQAPAAVAVIAREAFETSPVSSLVAPFNMVSGVRMEERSPGSYRLSVRGSSLRAPFGIRNIKIYLDDIPFTDATGNTYLNLVALGQLQRAEIVKGPAASFYGANTGGAVLLESATPPGNRRHGFTAGFSGGSFGLFSQEAGYAYNGNRLKLQVQQSHLQQDGYREQSALRRDQLSTNGRWTLNLQQQLNFTVFYTDLHYETPGGLTLEQFRADPQAARYPTATLPGAMQQQAGVYNRTLFTGLSHQWLISPHFSNTTSLLYSQTRFRNPFITNYEQRREANYGGRSVFRYQLSGNNTGLQVQAGGEWQQNLSLISNYDNNGGIPGREQYSDRVYSTQYFAFVQAAFTWNRLTAQAGLSRNTQLYRYRRLGTDPDYRRKTDGAALAPRFSAAYRLGNAFTVYGIASKGISSPTLAEVRPSDGHFYPDLRAERGWNLEAGVKGEWWQQRLRLDISTYRFELEQTIVRNVNAQGQEFFTNTGNTLQRGVEAFVQVVPVRTAQVTLRLSDSYTFQPYCFLSYTAVGADYSGKQLTGIPRQLNVCSADLVWKQRWSVQALLNNTGSLPLTDANDVFAAGYQLLQATVAYTFRAGAAGLRVYASADNLLDQVYSLGNDLNAAGRRYYNAAPGRNFRLGVAVGW